MTVFRLGFSIVLVAGGLFALSWGTYFMNQKDNLFLLGGVLLLFVVAVIEWYGFKFLWRKHEKKSQPRVDPV